LLGSVIEETGKRWRELILSLTPGQPSLT
jgi:hypothetical protein